MLVNGAPVAFKMSNLCVWSFAIVIHLSALGCLSWTFIGKFWIMVCRLDWFSASFFIALGVSSRMYWYPQSRDLYVFLATMWYLSVSVDSTLSVPVNRLTSWEVPESRPSWVLIYNLININSEPQSPHIDNVTSLFHDHIYFKRTLIIAM